ncbi:MAG: transposase [Elusimicrobiota bacterium]
MPRHRRLEIPGAVYHVITRGLERREIFKDDQDREEFLSRLEIAIKDTKSKCYGWVLMPNHFHLLIRAGVKPLGDLMRKLLTGYAIYFNRKHKRCGYLYQNRYKSILCQEEEYLLELIRYIHLNPLRGGVVKDIFGLNKYKWSGHFILIGGGEVEWQSNKEILERFGSHKGEAIKKYLEFIKDGLRMGKRDDLTGGGLKRSAGGWKGIAELKRNKEYWRGDERILGDGDFVNQVLKFSEEEMVKKDRLCREGWDINKLVKRVCEIMGVREEEIRKRSRENKISQSRALIIYWGNRELGLNGSELAKYFGITRPSISEAIIRGEKLCREYNYNLIT